MNKYKRPIIIGSFLVSCIFAVILYSISIDSVIRKQENIQEKGNFELPEGNYEFNPEYDNDDTRCRCTVKNQDSGMTKKVYFNGDTGIEKRENFQGDKGIEKTE